MVSLNVIVCLVLSVLYRVVCFYFISFCCRTFCLYGTTTLRCTTVKKKETFFQDTFKRVLCCQVQWTVANKIRRWVIKFDAPNTSVICIQCGLHRRHGSVIGSNDPRIRAEISLSTLRADIHGKPLPRLLKQIGKRNPRRRTAKEIETWRCHSSRFRLTWCPINAPPYHCILLSMIKFLLHRITTPRYGRPLAERCIHIYVTYL